MHKMLQHFHSNLEKDEEYAFLSLSLWMVKGDTLIGIVTLSISCPIASLLAEVVISQYRLVGYSLEAMWLLSLTASVVCICRESLQVKSTTIYSIQLFVLVLSHYLFLGAF